MIPRRYIDAWREVAPWPEDAQVEQDLVIERAVIRIFSDPFLQERLAFRGGTALHKFFLKPQVRYSEDIDLVQIKAEPIKETLSALRRQLSFLGKPSVKQKAHNNTLLYRFESEIPPVIRLRLKIEINCREHFTVLGYDQIEHKSQSGWFEGSCLIPSYAIEEMLGTKMRALYQRKKGRDLFDLYYALSHLDVDTEKIVSCFREYMAFSVDKPPSQKQYLQNMALKLEDPDFYGDIYALLRPGVDYDQASGYALVERELIRRI